MKEAIEILLQISEDQSVPRNIRRSATKSIEMLNDKSMELAVRAVNAIEELEDSTGDANTPFHTRTMIWQAITKLEIPRDKKEDQKDEYDESMMMNSMMMNSMMMNGKNGMKRLNHGLL